MFIDNENAKPRVVVMGGPNGAGKTTIAQDLIPNHYKIGRFVNADVIARGLSMFDPDSVALRASRIMLDWLHESARERVDFAFESTLASRTLEPWLRSIKEEGYEFHLNLIWLPAAEYSINRIVGRVALGGHFVPDDTVRRRYAGCFRNFFSLYQPIADAWTVYDNSRFGRPRFVATGFGTTETEVANEALWLKLKREYGNGN